MLDLVLQKEGGASWGSNYAMSTEHGEPRSCRMKNIARRMFTGQRERDVSVGMDSKTALGSSWTHLGEGFSKKIKLRIWILSLCICIPFIYSHVHGRSRIRFFLSYPLYRISGYFGFFNPMSDTLIKLWCWLGVKSNHRINHWMNLFYSWEKLSVFATWSSGRESLCSTTIGRNYWVFLCPAFLWLRLKVSISWTCSNSPSFSQILSQQYVWNLRGTKDILFYLLCFVR
jgi:hypothetical protein